MRLTERVIDKKGIEHIMTKYVPNNQKLKDEKLCQLEDIEEKLGINLITLFKALGRTIFAINTIDNLTVEEYDRYYPKTLYIGIDDEWYIQVDLDDGYFTYNTKDYGKTWALTKEELL